jgi:uncharacterized protein
MPHYTDYLTFSEAFVGFSQYARAEGLKIGIDETSQSLHVGLSGLWGDNPFFQYALASIFCSDPEDRPVFDAVFHRFWDLAGSRYNYQARFRNQSNLRMKTQATLVMLGQQSGKEEGTYQTKTTSGANSRETLRKTDFSLISQVDVESLNALCDQLVKEMTMRLRRKFRKGKQGQLDMARTIRGGISRGGHFFDLYQKERKKEKLRLVLMLDVSGSMDKYSFYLLRFIWLLRQHFSHIEAFTFSTRLLRITDHLQHKSLQSTLSTLGLEANHWSSGTKIGDCLSAFMDQYGKRVLNGRSMMIVLSDGLDTGEPGQLDMQLSRIRMKTNRLVWLNPLKGSEHYQPIQRGMKVALPYLDDFQPGHNLESLLTLENIIANA